MNIDILNVGIDEKWHLIIDLSPWLLLVAAVMILIWILSALGIFKRLRNHDVQLNVTLGNFGNVTLTPNYEVQQVAHQAWTELATRKAGILVDMDHDLIVEIYDSWYHLFSKLRDLIKAVPAKQLKNEDTKKLIDLLVTSMNRGLRPHLTQWQAKFRRWYEHALQNKAYKKLSPQEIQKKYPEYQLLTSDLLRINGEIVAYTSELSKLF